MWPSVPAGGTSGRVEGVFGGRLAVTSTPWNRGWSGTPSPRNGPQAAGEPWCSLALLRPDLYSGRPMKQMYHPDDLAAMDPLVLMRNLDHVRMTSRRLSYVLQQQVHLYTPEANKLRTEIDTYVEAERQIEWEMARRALRT